MSTLFLLAFEFFKIGLFAVGGGMATLPFLMDLAETYGWFSRDELLNMIAISQSTPGPLGVNMATYTGFEAFHITGALISTLALVLPAFLVLLIVAGFLQRFQNNKNVKAAFYGIRPAVTALIAYAVATLLSVTICTVTDGVYEFHRLNILLCAVTFVLMQQRRLRKLHPIFWIGLGAVAGILLKL